MVAIEGDRNNGYEPLERTHSKALRVTGINARIKIKVKALSMNYDREFEVFDAQSRHSENIAAGGTTSIMSQDIDDGRSIIDALKALATYTDEIQGIGKQGDFMRILGELSLNLIETQAELSDRLRTIDELANQVSILQRLLNNGGR